MQALVELIGKQRVEPAMAFDQRQLLEARAHDQELEMGLGALRDGVHIALIDHVQIQGPQGLLDPALDTLLTAHDGGISVWWKRFALWSALFLVWIWAIV
jgi:hypothetical protein